MVGDQARLDSAAGQGVVAAIISWNTVYLQRAVASRQRHETVPEALLRHISPLDGEHINLTGDYLWDRESVPESGNFHDLREWVTSAEAA